MTETAPEYIVSHDFIPKLKRALELQQLENFPAFEGIQTAGTCMITITFDGEDVILTTHTDE
jgi:hypothetical protein